MFPSENYDLNVLNASNSDADYSTSVDLTQSDLIEPIKILLFPPKNKQFRFNAHTNKLELESLPSEGPDQKLLHNEITLPSINGNISDSTPTSESISTKNSETKTNKELKVKEILKITRVFQNSKLRDKCFLKGCKWSGDGLCLLSNSEDCVLRLFEIDNNLIHEPKNDIEPVLQMKEGGTIYDYAWYSKMNSCDPVSCVFATTSQNSPIHLWDAYTGHLRATYQPINQYDEVTSAYSLAFTPDGSKIYAGFKKCLRIFDVSLPGRISEERNLKNKGKPFQSNILSSICINPIISNLYALGSYDKTVGIYTEPEGELLCILEGHCGGITQIMFSADGNYLFSGARKDDEILCWDLRNPGKVAFSIERKVDTQQKILFDLSPDQNYLITVPTQCIVRIIILMKPPQLVVVTLYLGNKLCERSSTSRGGTTDCNIKIFNIKNQTEKVLKPGNCFRGHEDCVNGVQFHPSLPIFASSSGQRHLPGTFEEDDDNPSYSKDSSIDNSIKIWSYSQQFLHS